ncbi:hypothetical protein QVA66_05770 [Staphylococcus chromogenes]|nr:hypothetical protein [Staphylococcus chromogenes]
MSQQDFDVILEQFRTRAVSRIAEFEAALEKSKRGMDEALATTQQRQPRVAVSSPLGASAGGPTPRGRAKTGWGSRAVRPQAAVRGVLQRGR